MRSGAATGFGASTRARLILFGGLYFAQGVPWGFVTIALMVRLTGAGLGPAAVGGIVSVALLPWTLKPFLGPFVDRVSFGRRRIVLGCELAMAATLVALAGADPRRTHALFLTLVFVNGLVAALQDVATDALAMDMLPDAERGRANGVMSAAKYGGMLVGGSGLVALAPLTGWPATYVLAAVLLLLPAPLVLMVREPAEPPEPHTLPVLARELLRSLARRATVLAVLFGLVSDSTDSFLYPLIIGPLRLSLGLGEQQTSALTAIATATAIGGSLLGGLAADRLGRRRAIVLGGATLAAAHLAFAAVTPSWTTLFGYQLASGLAGGVLYAAILALCMDLTNPALPATHFQFFMAMLNLRSAWASKAGGHLAERLSRPTMFLVAAAIELAPLLLLLAIDPRRAAASFKDDR